jgi:hypothetical protein
VIENRYGLHDWNDDDATRIPHRCAQAAASAIGYLLLMPLDSSQWPGGRQLAADRASRRTEADQ